MATPVMALPANAQAHIPDFTQQHIPDFAKQINQDFVVDIEFYVAIFDKYPV